jgi:hypothetical protein
MRFIFAAVALLALSVPALAQQAGSVTFSPPTTGGAPTGYRLYRDNTLIGPVTSGQAIPALFPANTGSWVFAVEAFNATGAGARSAVTATLGPVVPGAPVQITITAPCASANPPTCVITVTP